MVDNPLLITHAVAFKVDPVALQRYVRAPAPAGDIARDLLRRSELVWTAARRQIPIGHIGTITSDKEAANLRYTIVRRIDMSQGDPVGLVGSDHPRSLLHHEGSRPHLIVPRRELSASGRPAMLRFPAGPSGGFVFARRVHHPGTKPNRFLTDNLKLAGG